MLRASRIAAVHLALAAMLLRAMMPAGWMPDTTGKTGSPLVICTMHGPLVLTTDDPSKARKHPGACPFAAVAHLAQATGGLALALPMAAWVPAQKTVQHAAVVAAARHQPQSPRAPPRAA